MPPLFPRRIPRVGIAEFPLSTHPIKSWCPLESAPAIHAQSVFCRGKHVRFEACSLHGAIDPGAGIINTTGQVLEMAIQLEKQAANKSLNILAQGDDLINR